MKKWLSIILILLFFSVSIFSQDEKTPEEKLKEKFEKIYGKKGDDKKTSDSSISSDDDSKKKDSNVENSKESPSIYKDFFLASLSEDLYLTYLANENVSRRKMSEEKMIPSIKVGKSVIVISSVIEAFDVEVKKKKIKGKFLTENYATGKETKVSALKKANFLAYKSIGDKSKIGIGKYDKNSGGLIIYLEGDTYNTISFSEGEKMKEVVKRMPQSSAGFILQTSNDGEYLYSLVGTYDGMTEDLNIINKSVKIFEKF